MNKRIDIYLTEEDKAAFKKKCDEANMSMTQVGRLLILDYIEGAANIAVKKRGE